MKTAPLVYLATSMTTRKLVLVDLQIQMLQKDNLVCFPDVYGAVTQKLFSENQCRSFNFMLERHFQL